MSVWSYMLAICIAGSKSYYLAFYMSVWCQKFTVMRRFPFLTPTSWDMLDELCVFHNTIKWVFGHLESYWHVYLSYNFYQMVQNIKKKPPLLHKCKRCTSGWCREERSSRSMRKDFMRMINVKINFLFSKSMYLMWPRTLKKTFENAPAFEKTTFWKLMVEN